MVSIARARIVLWVMSHFVTRVSGNSNPMQRLRVHLYRCVWVATLLLSCCKSELNEKCGVDPKTNDKHLDCRTGLKCTAMCDVCEGTCEPRGDTPLGQFCAVDEECAKPAVCGRGASNE